VGSEQSRDEPAIPPLDLSREARTADASGTPAALIESARREDDIALLDTLDEASIAIEFPMGPIWREQTGFQRFVRLTERLDGKQYALVRR
jgi:hypothetical protein